MIPHNLHIFPEAVIWLGRRSNPQALFSVYTWWAVLSRSSSNYRETYVSVYTKFIKITVGQIRYAPGLLCFVLITIQVLRGFMWMCLAYSLWLLKPLRKLKHWWVITSRRNPWMQLHIHAVVTDKLYLYKRPKWFPMVIISHYKPQQSTTKR